VDPATGAKIAILVATIVLSWLFLLREAWRAWAPARLLLRGHYREAQAAAERLERSWMVRVFPSVRVSTRYAIGCALHLAGDLEASLTALAPIHSETRHVRSAVRSIEAANLVLLDREHARALALLEEAPVDQRPPEDVLLAAHAKLGLGDGSGAERLFDSAGVERAGGIRLGFAMETGRQHERIFHALRGLFLVKTGRLAVAQRDLEIASRSPITNVYAERSRAVLEARPPDPDDARSSLAPQVLASKLPPADD
jgi:hypothetical protein